jgi:hypothetical protein
MGTPNILLCSRCAPVFTRRNPQPLGPSIDVDDIPDRTPVE